MLFSNVSTIVPYFPNILASNRLKKHSDHQSYDRKGKKEVIPPASTSQTTESKIDEMAKLVKILRAKLNKLELEKNSNKPAQEGERNPNQIRRQFAPRFIPRERRNNDIQRERRENEDQRVPPPLQNNVVDEIEEDEVSQYEYSNQDLNYFGELVSEGFLTEHDYQNSEFFYANIYQTKSDLGPEVSADICQSKPKKSINLRSSPN